MVRDRTEELRRATAAGAARTFSLRRPRREDSIELTTISFNEDEDQFLAEVGQVHEIINTIRDITADIAGIHERVLHTIRVEDAERFNKELDHLMHENNKRAIEARNLIKSLDDAVNAAARGSSQHRLRLSQVRNLSDKFLRTMNEYREVQLEYQDKYRRRFEKSYLMVNPDASSAEVADVMERVMDTGPVFPQHIIDSLERAEARRALQDVEERHNDILKIEKAVNDLHHLFVEISTLIVAADEQLDEIDQFVNTTQNQVEAGGRELGAAVKLRKRARRKVVCITVLLIVLLAGAGIAIWLAIERPAANDGNRGGVVPGTPTNSTGNPANVKETRDQNNEQKKEWWHWW